MTKIYFDVASATTHGARDFQEDSSVVSFARGQDFGFAVLANGFGGTGVGDVASALATTVMFSHLKMQESKLSSGALNLSFALRSAAERVNAGVRDHRDRNSGKTGMATTILVPVIRKDRLYFYSVGNSALMLARKGALRHLNKMQTLTSELEMMLHGASAGKPKAPEGKQQLSVPVLDGTEISMAECTETPILLKEGDILIGATDGLQSVPAEKIAATLSERQNDRSADIADALLIAIAEEAVPDQDNASIVVVRMEPVSDFDAVIDLDDMPVLAQASAPEPEPVKEERKPYFYRGQKYYRD